jgi:hypothetical protein
MVGFLLGPGRTATLARHTIFLEAARRPELRADLLAATAPFWDLIAGRLAAAGSPDPRAHARLLLAYLDGLILDQLLRPDPAFDREPAVLALLRGLAG